MMRLRRETATLLAFCGLVATQACADASGGATELAIEVSTVGVDLDGDGYLLVLDGDSSRHLDPQGTAIVQVTPGEHAIGLHGVDANCVAEDAPGQVAARRGERSTVRLDVACRRNVGFAVIRIATFGEDTDANGYLISIGDTPPRRIDFSQDVQLFDLPVGSISITLSEIAENCTLTSDNPVILTVPFEAMGSAQLNVACVRNVGAIIVTATTSGFDIDPDGYTVKLTTRSASIGVNDSVTFSDVSPGTHILTLDDMAANCVPVPTARTNVGPFGTIAFSTTRHGLPEIYLMRSDGTELRRLNAPGRSPAWSPDGSRIAFSARARPRSTS